MTVYGAFPLGSTTLGGSIKGCKDCEPNLIISISAGLEIKKLPIVDNKNKE